MRRLLSLRESVLEHLRTAIITGEIAEGTIISAPTLGQSLGVSVTPVREAMVDLTREGLVETVKNKGFRVVAMTDTELNDLAQLRQLIEPPVMHLLINSIPDAAFTELTQLADACTAAAETERLEDYLRADRQFHALLLSFTGNPQIVEMATALRLRTRMYGLIGLAREGRLAQSSREHHALLAHLRAGDAEAAERLMHEHIGHARDLWATGATGVAGVAGVAGAAGVAASVTTAGGSGA